MPRLFVGNFDFEHRLATPGRQLSAVLQRLNAELATAWLAVADDGDYLWTPQPIDARFFEQAAADGLPRVIPVDAWDQVPAGVECVPWGWTAGIRELCDRYGWLRNDPDDGAVRAVNSRRFSAGLEEEWNIGLPQAGAAASLEQVEQFIRNYGTGRRWVIKAEFGMSGRERLIGCGFPAPPDRNWIANRLKASGAVFFEPWVDKVEEAGIQIDVPRQGSPRCLDVVPMLADDRGQYGGSLLPPCSWSRPEWEGVVATAMDAARRIQDLGYFGPLGIDAMQYRDQGERLRIRPLQDINARWTMGRLCLGFRRLLSPGESACWLHGAGPAGTGADRAVAALAALRGRPLLPWTECAGRWIATSPRTVGDQPVTHSSVLWIF